MGRIRQKFPERLPLAGLALLTIFFGCGRAPSAASRPGKQPSVASMVPAATDMLIAMGAKDHLVAVSNFDHAPEVASLPRAGDYQSVDWEKLSMLKPAVLISFYGPGRAPPGFAEKLATLQIKQVNVQPNRLDDVFAAITTLGDGCDEQLAANEFGARLRKQIDDVRKRTSGEPRVRTLIAISPTGADLVGRNTYLDDLLQAAGGENALTAAGYVSLDREAVAALHPDAVVQLLPDHDAASADGAKAMWDTLPDCPAAKNHRVTVFTQSFIMQPGSHVAEIADLLAKAIH